MKKIQQLIRQLYENSVMRYLFFGGCTTLVNLFCFYILRKCGVSLNIANLISIIAAILFAYVVNSRFVFQEKYVGIKENFRPFCKFVSARLVTMVIEVVSVWLLVEALHLHEMLGKFVTQFIVIVLNYIFSKFFVFAKKNS